MSLLELDNVHKRASDEPRQRTVLRGVCLEVKAGELVVVWGMRRSGRSTLLRVAAGIERPDAGTVRFDGRDLAAHGKRLIGNEIGYCHKSLRFSDGHTALDHAMVGLLSRWVPTATARKRARVALERAGAGHCAGHRQRELSSAEAIRVALARTLVLEPRLVVIDEPVNGVELIDRDPILALLRALADEGTAVLASTGESTGLSEADQALVLGGGELRGAPGSELAPVLTLKRDSAQRMSG
jgi:ABC-type multidrug transport system ATPase subunit